MQQSLLVPLVKKKKMLNSGFALPLSPYINRSSPGCLFILECITSEGLMVRVPVLENLSIVK